MGNSNIEIAVVFFLAIFLGVLLLAVAIFLLWRRKKRK
jgi:LPXTG-motif cell wall-anchored protein